MNRRLIYVCLCITLLSFFSCSKEYDDSMENLQAQVDLNAVYDSFGGHYVGSWWINDEQVSDGSSYVSCATHSEKKIIYFYEPTETWETGVPCKAIAERLFPDMDIANLPYNYFQPSGYSYSPLIVGYSNNTLYLTLPVAVDRYVQYWFSIFKDNTSDHIIIVGLDIHPSDSIVLLDKDSQSLTLNWLVKEVEINEYDKGPEVVRTVRKLNPEMKLTFIGTRSND